MPRGGILGRLGMYGLHLFILVQTAIWSFISILWFLVDSKGRLTHFYGARPWSRVLLWSSRVKVQVKGLENLQRTQDGPMVLVCNHQSLFDILALLAGLPLDFKFVVKKELSKVPLWGYAMKKAGYIFVERGQGGQAGALMREAVKKIKAGSAVLFFAEGTRSDDGRLGQFRRGAFVLASQAGADVVPVAIEGSAQVLPKKSWHIRPGLIKVTVLPVISDPALKKNSRKLMDATHQALSSALDGPLPAAEPRALQRG